MRKVDTKLPKPDYSGIDDKYKPLLDSYYIWKLLKENKLEAWPSQEYFKKYYPSYIIKSTLAEPLEYEGITFIGRFEEWFSAKKLSIDAKTEMPEILQTLSSINSSVVVKSLSLLDKADYKPAAAAITKGKRKGFANLKEIVELARKMDEKTRPFILHEALSQVTMLPYVDAGTFNKVFPEFKIRKPKGRKRKG